MYGREKAARIVPIGKYSSLKKTERGQRVAVTRINEGYKSIKAINTCLKQIMVIFMDVFISAWLVLPNMINFGGENKSKVW